MFNSKIIIYSTFLHALYIYKMIYTNINIKDNNNRAFKYVIGYEPGETSSYQNHSYISEHIGNVDLVHVKSDGSDLARCGDYWEKTELKTGWKTLPDVNHKTSKLYVYFPRFSVETYDPDKAVKYALTANVWVNGKQIVLGSYLISRSDSLATVPKKIFGDEYVEYIAVDIIDVHEFLNDSIWAVDKQRIVDTNKNLPASSSLLNVSLHPVVDGDEPGTYIMMSGYSGSQNSIRVDDGLNLNFLNASLNLCDTPNGKTLKFSIIDNRNNEELTPEWFEKFIKDTYNYYIKNNTILISYSVVMRNSSDVFSAVLATSNATRAWTFPMYLNSLAFDVYGIDWAWWKNYMSSIGKPLVLQGVVTIGGNDEDNNYREMFYMRTNEIPVTQEVFSYFLLTTGRKINLDTVNMNQLNISTVNKTEQIVYKYDNVSDVKSNIIQPVFFKARDLGNIVVHPEVTENICINLDQFKSKVKRFIIQIEGCSFHEIGRTGSGVIFKITGNILPKEKTSGLYYILDENSVLVTNGNYTYVM